MQYMPVDRGIKNGGVSSFLHQHISDGDGMVLRICVGCWQKVQTRNVLPCPLQPCWALPLRIDVM